MALNPGPDATQLLTTALEKLLYLESRLEAAEAAREEASREGEKHRQAAIQARRALSDWQKRATDAEVSAEGAEREVLLLRRELGATRHALNEAPTEAELARRLKDAEERLDRYAREREAWLDRMIALSRLRSGEGDELDLGGFIAELRAELMALRRGEDRVRATVSDRPAPPDAAELLNDAPLPELDAAALIAGTRLSRPEKTLARLCALDLGSDSPQVRKRAAERLSEAKLAVLNPLVQVKLRTEREPQVRVAMLQLLARTGAENAGLSLGQALSDPDPRVRAEAVEALSRREGEDLSSALNDPSPAVRRRAIARLPRTGATIDRLADALHDEDASVRHVAALALSSRAGQEAEAVLQAAAHFEDPTTRQLAREALARRGVEVLPPPEPVPEAQTEVPPEVPAEEPVPEVAEIAPEPVPSGPEPIPEPEPEPIPEPVVEAPSVDEELAANLVDEIRTTLRGRTPEELAERLKAPQEAIQACIDHLLALGQLVWRGRKLYLP